MDAGRGWILGGLLIGLVAGAGGGLAVQALAPHSPPPAPPAADEAALRDLRNQIALLTERTKASEIHAVVMDPPGLAASPTSRPGGTDTGFGVPPEALAASGKVLEEVATKAAKAVLAEQAAKDAEAAAKRPPPKKSVSLAQAARELGLSGGQEADIRAAYAEATEKFLKLMAEPDGDVEAIRRELSDAKGDQAKRAGLMGKYLPKMLPKFGEMMVIQSQREEKVNKVLGPDAPKFDAYQIEEEDPFGLRGNVSVGVSNR
jgi:hypothetical protein